MVRIGRNQKYTVIVNTSWAGFGHYLETKTIYTEIGDSFKKAFEFTFYEEWTDPPQYIDYRQGYIQLRILGSNKAFFDIETVDESTDGNGVKSDTITRYKFEGTEYVVCD